MKIQKPDAVQHRENELKIELNQTIQKMVDIMDEHEVALILSEIYFKFRPFLVGS